MVGGADRDRTDDPLLAKQMLSQLSYSPLAGFAGMKNDELRIKNRPPGPEFFILNSEFFIRVVGLGRFELPTSRLSGVRSNQLSYRPA